jgi:hypothetical protein
MLREGAGSRWLSARQDFDANVPEADFTDLAGHRRMSLKSEGAFGQPGSAAGKTVYRIGLGNLVGEHGLAFRFASAWVIRH